MKKTIAILLVLVIGMVGVWADSTETVKIHTEIVEIADFAITSVTTGALAIGDTFTTEELDVLITNADTPLGHLNVRTNSATGFKISILAPALENDDNTNAAPINYVFNLNGNTFNTESESSAKEMVVISNVNSLQVFNYAMSVDANDTEYANAASGMYRAEITVEFTAT